mgnify:CR=1 FL=1
MKKIENNFAVTGFVAKDAEVRQFTTTSVARFPLAVARQEKNGEDTKRISAFMNIEAWRKNENTGSFDQLTKGTLLTVEGYFKPEEWTDKDGVLHNRIVTVAVKFYPAVDKEEEVLRNRQRNRRRARSNSCLFETKRPEGRFCFARYRSGTSILLYSFILHTKSPPSSIDFPVQS